ncbi:hypothetical protein J6590_080596 [Homalodisca vitripennis]|nr:hypothetical protein J6590_080596 [Homalodisca vitripennis]
MVTSSVMVTRNARLTSHPPERPSRGRLVVHGTLERHLTTQFSSTGGGECTCGYKETHICPEPNKVP